MSVTNPQAANAALSHLRSEQGHKLADVDDITSTQAAIERRTDDPIVDDGDADTRGYPCDEDAVVGSLVLDTDADGGIRFNAPNGRTGRDMLDRFQRLEERNATLSELDDFVWGTLATWSVDDDHDYDYWADEHHYSDCLGLLPRLAMRGNR